MVMTQRELLINSLLSQASKVLGLGRQDPQPQTEHELSTDWALGCPDFQKKKKKMFIVAKHTEHKICNC